MEINGAEFPDSVEPFLPRTRSALNMPKTKIKVKFHLITLPWIIMLLLKAARREDFRARL